MWREKCATATAFFAKAKNVNGPAQHKNSGKTQNTVRRQ